MNHFIIYIIKSKTDAQVLNDAVFRFENLYKFKFFLQ